MLTKDNGRSFQRCITCFSRSRGCEVMSAQTMRMFAYASNRETG